jgi:hypothetical protein
MYYREIPASRRIRCRACESEALDWVRSGKTETLAIAKIDALYRIPWSERGTFHL